MPRLQDRLVLDRLPLGKNVADRRGVGGQVVGHEAIDLIWIDPARRPDVPPLFGVRPLLPVAIAVVGHRVFDLPAAVKLIVLPPDRGGLEPAHSAGLDQVTSVYPLPAVGWPPALHPTARAQ